MKRQIEISWLKILAFVFGILLVIALLCLPQLLSICMSEAFNLVKNERDLFLRLLKYHSIIAFILTAGVVIASIAWLIIDYRERKNIVRLNLMKDLLDKNQQRIEKLQNEVLKEKYRILDKLERASTLDSILREEIQNLLETPQEELRRIYSMVESIISKKIDRQVEVVKEIKEILEKLIEVESREMESLLKQNEIMVRAISEINPPEEE